MATLRTLSDQDIAGLCTTGDARLSDTQSLALVPLQQLVLVGTKQFIAAGVLRIILNDFWSSGTVFLGQPKTPPSFSIRDGYFYEVIGQLNLVGSIRGILMGTASLVLFDYGARSRIVLAGRGF